MSIALSRKVIVVFVGLSIVTGCGNKGPSELAGILRSKRR